MKSCATLCWCMSQNNNTAAVWMISTSSVGVELSSYVNAFLSRNKFAKLPAT